MVVSACRRMAAWWTWKPVASGCREQVLNGSIVSACAWLVRWWVVWLVRYLAHAVYSEDWPGYEIDILQLVMN
jgi:hypothetical protein